MEATAVEDASQLDLAYALEVNPDDLLDRKATRKKESSKYLIVGLCTSLVAIGIAAVLVPTPS